MADLPEGFIEATPPLDFELDPAVAAVYRSIGLSTEIEKPTQIVAVDQFGVPIPDVDPIPLTDEKPPETPPKTEEKPPETPPKTEEKPPETPPKTEEKPPETPPKTEEKPPETPPKTEEKPPEPSVMDRLGKAVDKLAEKLDAPPTPPAPPTPTQPDVDPRIALRLEALAVLEQSPQHRGQPLVAQYKTFLTKFAAYQTEWERANAGKAFDPNDEDHEAFVAAHSPKVTDDEIIRAEARVETLREVENRLEQERAVRRAQESEKFARESATKAPDLFLASLEAKSVDELKTKDPALAFAANELLGQVPALVRATHQVFSGRLNEADPMHAHIVKTFEQYDAALAKEQVTSPDGRAYVPLAKWGALTPAQRAQSWTLAMEPEELSRMVIREAAQAVKTRAEQVRAWFPAPAPAAAPPPAPVVPKPPASAPPSAPKPTAPPPSGGDAPPVAPGSTAGKPSGQSFVQYF